jgi:hypothetical protein
LRFTDLTERRSVARHVPWGEDAFRSEDIDPVAIRSDSVGAASVDGSGLNYEDEARMRHPLL